MARKHRSALVLGLAGLLLAVAAAAALASFHPIDGSLNVNSAVSGQAPNIVGIGGVPYVSWGEGDTTTFKPQATVKRLEGGSWVRVGGQINNDPAHYANPPRLADVAGVPYVTWSESNGTKQQIYVKRFNGTTWEAVGGSLNIDTTHAGTEPSIASIDGAPYVAWGESYGTNANEAFIRVARLVGTTWVPVGTTVNPSETTQPQAPRITSVAGVPYVTWFEGATTHKDVRVARFDGTNWVAVGGALNDPASRAVRPDIADVAGVPYVAWRDDTVPPQMRVARFDGTNWVQLGSANVDPTKTAADTPSIVNVGGAPWVTFAESAGSVYQARVRRFDGTSWVSVGGPLNAESTETAAEPGLGVVNGVPFAAWAETTAGVFQIRAGRELIPTCNGGSVAVPHDSATTVPLQCTDPDGDTLTLSIVTGPAHGTLGAIDQGAGTVTYTPTSGYTGPDSISFKASDGADSNVATVNLTVAPAGQPPPLPVISRLKMSPTRFPAARRGASVARKPGTKVSYRDSQLTTTTFTVLKPKAGIRRGGKCVKRKKGQKGKRCTLLVRVGKPFTHKDRAGTNSFRFTGRVKGRRKYARLRPGSYRLRAVPGFKGRTGKAKTVRFRIVR